MTQRKSDDFQSRATKVGRAWADWCNLALQQVGFALLGPTVISEAGVEIDQVARNRTGQELYFQFKGSSKLPRPGLRRSDTVKKALCDAFLLDKLGIGPYLIITSHKPKEGSSSAKMVELAGNVVFDIICISDDDDHKRLEEYAEALLWRSKLVAKRQTPTRRPKEIPPQQLELFPVRPLRSPEEITPRRKKKLS